jgi:predicted acylesterase/phospholipase RssA
VLKQVEALLGGPLYEHFDLIFGTSTGAIIAALLALGHTVDQVHALYKDHVPAIMRNRTRRGRSAALADATKEVFGGHDFTAAKTGVGIVATRWVMEKPMIFKASVGQAHGRHATFQPGFGCTIGEAVKASCSAYPFFKKTIVHTHDGSRVELIDGGYCANNPTLYALADAIAAMQRDVADVRVLSVGVGEYPEPRKWSSWVKRRYFLAQLLQKTLNVNTQSMEQLRAILFKRIPTVRINDTFDRPEMATDLMESDLLKLNILYQEGGESFAKHEEALKLLFDKQQPEAQTAGPSKAMPLPETQLDAWSSQGAIAGSRDTYATVKLALEASDTPYAQKNYEVFLQGSYCNDTNVYAESDVDVVICLKTIFLHDLTGMTPPERIAFDQAYANGTDTFGDFKAQVLQALRNRFGASVTPGPKAIKIPPNGARRSADVIVATNFRRYHRFVKIYDETFDEGICFFDNKNVRVANYPKQHSANCTAKHQATNSWFKPAVRILKNMRQRLVDTNAIEKGIAPSYFLEGLLYNIPASCFGKSYQATMREALAWVLANDRTKFACANEQYYLLRDTPVTWPAANCRKFLDEVVKLWDGWK